MTRTDIGLLAAVMLTVSVTAACTTSASTSQSGRSGGASGSSKQSVTSAPVGSISSGSSGFIGSKQAVLQPADAPPGTRYLASASGPSTIADLVKGDKDAVKEASLLRSAGFRSAYHSIITGLQLPESVLRGHIVASFAVVFGTPHSATVGLSVLAQTASASGTHPTPVAVAGLGPHVHAIQYQLSTFPGDSYLISWQEQNAVRILVDAGGTGVVTLADATQLARAIAAGGDRQVTAGDVSQLVLQPADAPADTTLIHARSGPRTITQFAPANADRNRLRQLGFAAGYVNEYLSPALASPPSTKDQSSLRQSDYIASEAQQYSSHAAAKQAYTLFRAREQRLLGNQAAALTVNGLGPDAGGFRYVDHRSDGDLIGYAYFWCQGTLMLSLFDVGTQSFATPATAQHLAMLMAQHASG